ncbi:hypothetical protein [Winogradskyella tangerina]|uniref:hypothetical protein n=1 Tax=Winogradskyella tangerina TaxID=2023240 RepID=UPI000DBE2855|nr:hypothetical protein [Winogradskyella tangerina]
MSNDKKSKQENLITIRAINIETNKVIYESFDGEEVLKKAEESGEDFILDFETNVDYNFVF